MRAPPLTCEPPALATQAAKSSSGADTGEDGKVGGAEAAKKPKPKRAARDKGEDDEDDEDNGGIKIHKKKRSSDLKVSKNADLEWCKPSRSELHAGR